MANKQFPGLSDKDLAQITRSCKLTSVAGQDIDQCVSDEVKRRQQPAKDTMMEHICDLDSGVRRSMGVPAGACKPKGRQH